MHLWHTVCSEAWEENALKLGTVTCLLKHETWQSSLSCGLAGLLFGEEKTPKPLWGHGTSSVDPLIFCKDQPRLKVANMRK